MEKKILFLFLYLINHIAICQTSSQKVDILFIDEKDFKSAIINSIPSVEMIKKFGEYKSILPEFKNNIKELIKIEELKSNDDKILKFDEIETLKRANAFFSVTDRIDYFWIKKKELKVCVFRNVKDVDNINNLGKDFYENLISIANAWNRNGMDENIPSFHLQSPIDCNVCTDCEIKLSLAEKDLPTQLQGSGSDFAMIGNQALSQPTNASIVLPSLQFEIDTNKFRYRILHEFGHILGLLHEFNNPNSCEVNMQKLIKEHYGNVPENILKLNFQTIKKTSNKKVISEIFDDKSIMNYYDLSQDYFTDCDLDKIPKVKNSILSDDDKKISDIYNLIQNFNGAIPQSGSPIGGGLIIFRTLEDLEKIFSKLDEKKVQENFREFSNIFKKNKDSINNINKEEKKIDKMIKKFEKNPEKFEEELNLLKISKSKISKIGG